MKWIKFTNPNLIPFFTAILFSLTFFLPKSAVAAECFGVEILISKSDFEKNKITSFYGAESGVANYKTESVSDQIEADSEGIEQTQKNDTAKEVQSSFFSDTIQLDPEPEISSENLVSTQNETAVSPKLKNKPKIASPFARRNHILIRIFGEEKVLKFKKDLIDFGYSHFSLKGQIRFSHLVDEAFDFQIVIMFLFLVCLFVLHILIVLLVLYYSNRNKSYNERYTNLYHNLYEMVTLAYLFNEITWEMFLVKLKKIRISKNRKILTSILLNFHENLKGGMDEKIPVIYTRLNLQKDAFKATKSFILYKKVRAMHELIYLYPEGALKIIPAFLKHSHEGIRAEAQKAYIILNPDHPFDFLRTLNKPFSRWTQLSAFQLLRLPQLKIPSFSKYLKSTHHGVRIFCLQMIIYFQQLENVEVIFHLLESHNELTRTLSYKAINDLRLYDGAMIIKKKYRDETERNKLEIVKTLCNIGSNEDIDFLEIIFKYESIALRLEACRSLYYMSPESKERLLGFSKTAYPELDLYIAHITDKRI